MPHKPGFEWVLVSNVGVDGLAGLDGFTAAVLTVGHHARRIVMDALAFDFGRNCGE